MKKTKNRVLGGTRMGSKEPEVVIRAVASGGTQVKFGAVTIAAAQLDEAIAARNVEKGQNALARAAKRLAQPGISIRAAKDVPLYSVDEARPNRLVRKLNGKVERGILENGRFIAVDE